MAFLDESTTHFDGESISALATSAVAILINHLRAVSKSPQRSDSDSIGAVGSHAAGTLATALAGT